MAEEIPRNLFEKHTGSHLITLPGGLRLENLVDLVQFIDTI